MQSIITNHPECKLIETERQFKNQMDHCFELECEFSKILSAACQSLSKYVANEDVEEFFYCKKEPIAGG